ncbi:MAG: hypothetical protein J5589_12225 [Firmicutes bacterium]|nr:hypothetical protein [Bacillota bacterium]
MVYYEDLLERRKELIEQIKEIKSKIILLPDGQLHIQKDRKSTKWMVSIKDKEGYVSRFYLPKSKLTEARKYAFSMLYHARLFDRERELKATERYLKTFDPRYHGLPEKCPSKEREVLDNPYLYEMLSFSQTDKQRKIDEWKKEEYPDNSSYYPQQLIHRVSDDLTVRSKSESIIAEELIRLDLPFRYEMRIGEGYGSIVCDFVILDPKTLKTYYLEHFGLMDESEYAKNAAAKISNYASREIYLGVNLIVTAETKKHPLTREYVRKVLSCFLSI